MIFLGGMQLAKSPKRLSPLQIRAINIINTIHKDKIEKDIEDNKD